MIRYLKRNYRDLNKGDLVRLRRLTIRERGQESGFKLLMDGQWGDLDTTKVVIAKDTDTGRYVGWTTLTVLPRTSRIEVGVFVSWKYRRRGIATKLVEKGMRFCKAEKGRCFMSDDISVAFYRRFGAVLHGKNSDGWGGQSSFTMRS